MTEDRTFAEQLRRVEALVAAVEATADPAAQANLRELLQAVLDLHGRGLARVLELCGAELTGQLASDPLVSSVLLLHDLHPTAFEARVRQALDSIGPGLSAQGCTATLVSAEEGVVRVRLERRTQGHHASEGALRRLTEEALWELAPDAEGLEIEADLEPERPEPVPLVKLRVPSEAGGVA